MSSSQAITSLKGVGPRVAERLQRLGIGSVQDLLFHLPLRYEDRTRVVPIGSLRPGDQVVIEGVVQLAEIKYGKRRTLLVHLADGTGRILVRFFHFNTQQKDSFERGVRLRCYGEARRGQHSLELIHPEYRTVSEADATSVEEHLTPIYPTTEGLHQLSLRQLTERALEQLKAGKLALDEFLPASLREQLHLPELAAALLYVHRPPPDAPVELMLERQHPTQRRLAFEELLAHTLSLKQLREQARSQQARSLQTHSKLVEQFITQLPFVLTAAQQRVLTEIASDVNTTTPMLRLVQGDVGSGKTVVAAIAALHAVASGFQAAVMAPTEILAEQHYRNFSQWLVPLGIQLAWLSGKLKTKPRREAMEAMASGDAQVVIGTHALFQDEVSFNNLALLVIDEQHRFGVHQRLALREKGVQNGYLPHQLIMTATPIPRTLAMTAYADLDCSVIDELPPGRKPIETVVLPDARRDEVVQRVHRICAEGRQVYWVCTLIEESEALQCQAAEDTASQLAEALPDLRIGLVHGRLKPEQKERVMAAFKAAEIDLLVATTVIEVGVDVPNASLMIIENAERLGLAQLHQLRGRVGRGTQASVCVLMYHGALSENARARLAVMRESNDGFVIAQKDLDLRGPGEVLGTRQTGVLLLQIADLQRDQAMLPQVQAVADTMLAQHPEQVTPLIRRWLGERTRYADV